VQNLPRDSKATMEAVIISRGPPGAPGKLAIAHRMSVEEYERSPPIPTAGRKLGKPRRQAPHDGTNLYHAATRNILGVSHLPRDEASPDAAASIRAASPHKPLPRITPYLEKLGARACRISHPRARWIMPGSSMA